MLTPDQIDPGSVLRRPASGRVALGTSIVLTVALCLAGARTLLALSTAQHHQVAAISQGSDPVPTEPPLALNRLAS